MKVLFEKKGPIAYVTINRPERLNACDFETYGRLSQIEKDILSDSETYDINECIYKESTFQHLAIGPDLFRDSIEVYNYARERRNHRLHRGHCLIILEYRYRGTSPSISSIQLKVLPGGL